MQSLNFCRSFFIFFLFSIPLFAEESVYIYAGPGVSQESFVQTEKTISYFLHPHYRIQSIYPEQIINDEWEKDAALLIFPGGADIPYRKALDGTGNRKICSYVEEGGAFLGICAGAYYGGAFVDFAQNTDLEVRETRELSFFPGIVRGPILAEYNYQNESGARAAKIFWSHVKGFNKNRTFSVYYNGGGYFVNAQTKKNVFVLASYQFGKEFAAIVECHVGHGKAILSGVHFEYDPYKMDNENPYLNPIISTLVEKNQDRLKLVTQLLERLNLKCNKIL